MRCPIAAIALALALLCPPAAWPQLSVSIDIAPPPLLVYAQPPVPGDGYIWVPGYWRWSDDQRGYFWVPGTWVMAPNPGDLWTPGYWVLQDAGYFWHVGYWGPRVGYYGGIDYGHGYAGSGYRGGRWEGRAFHYNRAVSNVDDHLVHGAYGRPAGVQLGANRPSFNGGSAGVAMRPTAGERRFQSAEHPGPGPDQLAHEHAAQQLPTQRATGPHGLPQVAATPRPSAFTAPNVEPARPPPAAQPQRQEPQGRALPRPPPQPAQPPHQDRPAGAQPRPEAPRGAAAEPPHSAQRNPGPRPEQRPQEGPPRGEH